MNFRSFAILLFCSSVLAYADSVIQIKPSTGLHFGPHKQCVDLLRQPEITGRQVIIAKYDNGFKEIIHRKTKDYNQETHIALIVTQLQLDGQWINNHRQRIQYNSSTQIQSIRKCIWMNDHWILSSRILFQYNKKNQLIKQDSEIWNPQTRSWQPNYKLESQWDNDQNIVDLHYDWRDSDNDGECEWINDAIDTYDFNADGKVILWKKTEHNINNQWILMLETAYKYNDHRQLTTETTQSRFWEEGALEFFDKTIYTYNSTGKLASSRDYCWNGISWDTTSKTITQYETDGTIVKNKMNVDDQRFVSNTPVLLMEPRS